MSDIDDCTDDELREMYAKYVPLIELFNTTQEPPLTDHEAGLLLFFVKWLNDKDIELTRIGSLQ